MRPLNPRLPASELGDADRSEQVLNQDSSIKQRLNCGRLDRAHLVGVLQSVQPFRLVELQDAARSQSVDNALLWLRQRRCALVFRADRSRHLVHLLPGF